MGQFDLATLGGANLPTQQNEAFDFMEKGGTFTPNIRFSTPTSNAVAEGKVQANHYALYSGNEITDLGTEIDVAVLARRPKAMDVSDTENIRVSYDPKVVDGEPTGEFKRIRDESFEKDSGCMFGTEYLVYLGGEYKEFALIHFASQSARFESKNMTARLGDFATLKSQTIKGKKRTYNTIAVLACTDRFDLPEAGVVVKELEKFNNPEEEGSEPAPTPEAGTGRAM